MKNFRTAFAVAAFAAFFATAAGAESGWSTDYKLSQKEAKENHKRVLLNFTGSDWCGWCIRLQKEVFDKPEFADYAAKNLVLVELDFPARKQLSDPIRQQNMEMAQRYQIQGFPTIIVLNGDGQAVGALGYTPGGPSAFIAELEKLPKG
ncbi:MAG: thioredoxin family protein [Verrucomicrobiota bacterium]